MEKTRHGDPVKAPGMLKKPLPERVFERRFLKYLEHPGDRSFFASCFEVRENTYILRPGLEKGDIKKLKELLKAIKRGRQGAVKWLPLVFAAALIAALVIFFSVFANPLLERALETGLEAVFEARAEVDGFRLSLLRFRIATGGITVADRDRPMTNLFQTGRLEIRLNPGAILRGKIYIEEIRADLIRFGTERAVSGALPERPPKVKKEKPKSDAPPLVDLQNFDALALLNREYDKLKTPRLYDQAISAYTESLAKWQSQGDLAKTRTRELQARAQPLLNLNANNIRDIEAITRTVQDINAMISTVQTAAEEVSAMVGGIEADIKAARDLEQSARSSLTEDIAHLKSYVDLGSGAAFAALEPSIREILSDTAERYLDYGIRGLEALEMLKARSAAQPKQEKPKETPKAVFRGRNVIFPTRRYPAFYLGILASDFTLNGWNWAFDLQGVSSDPDLSARPVTLALGLTEEGGGLVRQAGFQGSADFRTNAAQRFSAGVQGTGFPFSLGDQLGKVGIKGFTGAAAFSVNLSGRTDGGVSGGGEVRINQAQLTDPVGTLAQAVDTAVREAGSVDLAVRYAHQPGGEDEFKIDTNIADLIARALRRTAEAYAKKAMDEIERVLRERISGYIDGRFVSKEEMDTLFKAARGDKTATDQLKNTLDNKRAEFEQKLKTAANQAVEQAKDEALRQANQAAQDVLQGKTPTLQVPSLPGGGGIRLPGR